MFNQFRCNILAAATLCLLILGTLSCRKAELNRKITSSESQALAQRVFSNLFAVTHEAVSLIDFEQEEISGRYFLGNCGALLIDDGHIGINGQLIFTLDFGLEGCIGGDGVFRSGKLVIAKSEPFKNVGAFLTVRLDNYKMNTLTLNGTLSILNVGKDSHGYPGFDFSVSDGEVHFSDDRVISWGGIYRYRQIAGGETNISQEGIPGLLDDTFLLYGKSEGLDEDGRDFTAEITSPLSFSLDCKYIGSGSEEIRPDGLLHHGLHYGNGVCDPMAMVEIEGEVQQIVLR